MKGGSIFIFLGKVQLVIILKAYIETVKDKD